MSASHVVEHMEEGVLNILAFIAYPMELLKLSGLVRRRLAPVMHLAPGNVASLDRVKSSLASLSRVTRQEWPLEWPVYCREWPRTNHENRHWRREGLGFQKRLGAFI